MSQTIPVVFAANDKYVPYLGVALTSLIKYASSKNAYKIYILNTQISDFHKSKLMQLEQENIKIFFYDVSKKMEGKNIKKVAHLSPEATYRLLIDQLFLEYKKVLYLDSDIIIRHDIAELFQIDLGENILGASRGELFPSFMSYLQDELMIDAYNYFNSGVLIINVEQFRKHDIGRQGLEMLSKKSYWAQDQDVLNILCEKHVQFINGRWNVEWQHQVKTDETPIIDDSRKEKLGYVCDPYIIHYVSHIKPWVYPEIPLADYFWEIAKASIFFEEIFDLWNYYLFPWNRVSHHSRIILYGYGRVGHVFYEQIRKTNYCDIIAVCDQKNTEKDILTVPLICIEEIWQFNFEYVIIAIEKEETAKSVVTELLNKGIPEEKIVWENPIRRKWR